MPWGWFLRQSLRSFANRFRARDDIFSVVGAQDENEDATWIGLPWWNGGRELD